MYIINTKGIRREISISKIKKISLIIKKWTLKGGRALVRGSKPHSNGDIFSRSLKDFLEIIKFKRRRSAGIKKKGIKIIGNCKIIYIKLD